MLRRIGVSALALLLPVAGARAEETLQKPGLRERVKVERTQFFFLAGSRVKQRIR